MKCNKSGFTLVEIILAMAILGILAAAFLPIFYSSFMQIVSAGNRSKALNYAQSLNESKIITGAATATDSLSFVFTDSNGDNAVTVQIQGEHVQNNTLQIFLPEK